jgi:magnesium transporter
MIYLSRMLGKPVVDASGEEIGTVYDIAIATGEIFPRVTALAFLGPSKTPFMLSWRKYVEDFDDESITLNAARDALRFSYLQPDEVLLHRDLLNKQIVDTQGMKVVRVNDLKLSESRNQLRLLGAEVGVRGVLRGIAPALETAVAWTAARLGRPLRENLIAWNYMDLLDRDLGHVKLSVTHKRLHELHPADVADILERLNPTQRGNVFDHLDNTLAAEAISEMEDEYQADVVRDLTNQRASDILELMDPDDAADIIGDLPYDVAERLLRLMGLKEQRTIRKLLGYKDRTAGGLMTPEFTRVTEEMTVTQVIEHLRGEASENETIYYIYVVDDDGTLTGVVSLRDLILAQPETTVEALVERDVTSVDVGEDQEKVADLMSKYDLLAVPVVDETGRILGIVTVDDALDVMEQESAEDLALATGSSRPFDTTGLMSWLGLKSSWLTVWLVLGVVSALALRAFSGLLSSFVVVVLFIPLVLRLSEDIAGHSLAVLIEAGEEEDRPSFGRQLSIDLLAGAVLGIVTALIVLVLLELLKAPLGDAVALSIATAATVLLIAALGAVVPWVVVRRGGGGFRATATLISTGIAAVGLVVYLSLAALLHGVLRL